MGFDMYWVTKDDDEDEAVAQARKARDRAIDARKAIPSEEFRWRDDSFVLEGVTDRAVAAQRAVADAGRALDDARRSYFRLNMWAMGRYCDIMHELNMVCSPELPPWPEPADFGIPGNTFPAEGEYPEWDKAVANHKRAHHGECPGIPLHKFGSNDGWLVTPVEIDASLEAVQRAGSEEVLHVLETHDPHDDRVEEWNGWLRFLRGAREHDGFEVR